MTDELIKGLEEFKRYQYEDGALMPTLAEEGQDPKHFIISCIDSRCNPGTIFRSKPGKFFSHKAMGAIVRPYKQGTALAAALHFALEYNSVETIIVLGHTQCGAIKALTDDIDDDEIRSFIKVAKSGHEKAKSCCDGKQDILKQTEQEVILESANNLKTYPSVKKALEEGRLEIRAWQFNMKSGDLYEHDVQTGHFTVINLDSAASDRRQTQA